jgi:hypothetical protein
MLETQRMESAEYTILLVDDEELMRYLVVSCLFSSPIGRENSFLMPI